MSRRFKTIVRASLAALALAGVAVTCPGSAKAGSSAPGPEACMPDLRASVARLVCTRTGAKENHGGSAFLIQDEYHLVTAAHVACDCSSINATFMNGQTEVTIPATLERMLASRDLALLRLSRPAPVNKPFKVRPQRVSPGEDTWALGFPRNVNAPQDERLSAKIATTYGSLANCVSSDARITFKRTPTPFTSGSSEILNLGGTLRPGHSGAPILDAQCRVVGVGNGGLDDGRTAWSWAIPAEAIADLLTSTEAPARWNRAYDQPFAFSIGLGSVIGEQFATRTEPSAAPPPPPAVQIGNMQFTQVATRKLGTIRSSLQGSDDPRSLEFLIQAMQARFPLANLNDLEFDIYQETKFGATFVTPHGWKVVGNQVMGNASGIFAVGVRPEFGILAILADFQNQLLATTASGTATQNLWMMNAAGGTWFPDFTLTYGQDPATGMMITRARPDGVLYTRKGWNRVHVNQWTGMQEVTGFIFESHLVKNGALFAVSLVCQVSPNAGVALDNDFAAQYMSAVIAVHLTTFSG